MLPKENIRITLLFHIAFLAQGLNFFILVIAQWLARRLPAFLDATGHK